MDPVESFGKMSFIIYSLVSLLILYIYFLFLLTLSQTPGHLYRYNPVKNDAVDRILAELIDLHRPLVPFYRLSAGIYLYGSRKVLVKLGGGGGNKLIFRVGGGYCSFEEFIAQFTPDELGKMQA